MRWCSCANSRRERLEPGIGEVQQKGSKAACCLDGRLGSEAPNSDSDGLGLDGICWAELLRPMLSSKGYGEGNGWCRLHDKSSKKGRICQPYPYIQDSDTKKRQEIVSGFWISVQDKDSKLKLSQIKFDQYTRQVTDRFAAIQFLLGSGRTFGFGLVLS